MADPDERLEGLDAVWRATEPRPDFTARVLARLDDDLVRGRTPATPRRWMIPALAALAAAAVTCFVVLLIMRPRAGDATARASAQGSLTAETYTTVALGQRGVVVAHAGAVLAWTVTADGHADVHQIAGVAFYRVESGGPFVVRTPSGEVRVTGTCFTVAVGDGVVTVDVHEGVVEIADATSMIELRPGDRGHLGGAAPARRRPPRPEDVATARGNPSPGPTPIPEARTGRDDCFCFSDPRNLEADQTLLDEWAGICRVRADLPPIIDGADVSAIDEAADQLGLVGAERVAFHEAAVEMTDAGLARVREIYVDATGDAEGADALDSDAQVEQIVQTGALGEDALLRARMSQERAGHAPVPVDHAQMTPFEELYRLTITAADEFERLLGARIGSERAHALRLRFGGWPGPDFDWFGCP